MLLEDFLYSSHSSFMPLDRHIGVVLDLVLGLYFVESLFEMFVIDAAHDVAVHID